MEYFQNNAEEWLLCLNRPVDVDRTLLVFYCFRPQINLLSLFSTEQKSGHCKSVLEDASFAGTLIHFTSPCSLGWTSTVVDRRGLGSTAAATETTRGALCEQCPGRLEPCWGPRAGCRLNGCKGRWLVCRQISVQPLICSLTSTEWYRNHL